MDNTEKSCHATGGNSIEPVNRITGISAGNFFLMKYDIYTLAMSNIHINCRLFVQLDFYSF